MTKVSLHPPNGCFTHCGKGGQPCVETFKWNTLYERKWTDVFEPPLKRNGDVYFQENVPHLENSQTICYGAKVSQTEQGHNRSGYLNLQLGFSSQKLPKILPPRAILKVSTKFHIYFFATKCLFKISSISSIFAWCWVGDQEWKQAHKPRNYASPKLCGDLVSRPLFNANIPPKW